MAQVSPRWKVIVYFAAFYLVSVYLIVYMTGHDCPTATQIKTSDSQEEQSNLYDTDLHQLGGEPIQEPAQGAVATDGNIKQAPTGSLGVIKPLWNALGMLQRTGGPLGTRGMRVAPKGTKRVGKKGRNSETVTRSPFKVERLPPDVVLDPNFSPNTVFTIWCGRRWFEFHHYLSVKSVMREVRPDNFIFYYDSPPVLDSWVYNTWFDELKDEYPFFRPVYNNDSCKGHNTPDTTFIYKDLTLYGGMYVNEHTVFNSFPISLRNYSLVDGLDKTTMYGYLMAKVGYPGKYGVDYVLKQTGIKTTKISCIPSEALSKSKKPMCVHVKSRLFPKDIWELDTAFGRLARKVFYGNPEINLPKPSYDELIPNIAHIVWIGGGEMDYLFYLCVLSLIYVAEVDRVYIHGDGPPTGVYWMRIKDNPKLKTIYRETPKTVYGTRVNVLSHVTDVWRVDFMIKYGGIYVDTDTVFVKPLDRKIRGYDAVGTYDWTYWNPPYPDTINFGVAIGKKNAKYWQLFQKSMKWFIDSDWSFNGLRQPYRIKERNPELLLINPYLQVTCYMFKCHPTWSPHYHNESYHHLNTDSMPDWKSVYAFHWTMPTPPELENENNLMQSKTMFAEVGRNVLYKAGLISENQVKLQ